MAKLHVYSNLAFHQQSLSKKFHFLRQATELNLFYFFNLTLNEIIPFQKTLQDHLFSSSQVHFFAHQLFSLNLVSIQKKVISLKLFFFIPFRL
jgi:hypothetical protein